MVLSGESQWLSPDPADRSPSSWYAVDFRKNRTVGSVELDFLADGERYQAPAAYQLQYRTGDGWQDIPLQQRTPGKPLANGENRIEFPAVSMRELRIALTNPPAPARFRLIEIKAFAP